MESSVVPTPREHTHTIIPHGHTRRVPVEAVCRVAEIPGALLCPCQDESRPCDSESEAAAPAGSVDSKVRFKSVEEEAQHSHGSYVAPGGEDNLASQPGEALQIHASPVQDAKQDAESNVESNNSETPIPVAYLSPPEQSSREPSQPPPAEQEPRGSVTEAAPQEAGAPPAAYWLSCWNSQCCGSSVQPEPEGTPPPPTKQSEPLPAPESTEEQTAADDGATCWSASCCGGPVKQEPETAPRHTEKHRPPAPAAADPMPQRIPGGAPQEKDTQARMVHTKEEGKAGTGQIVYIDHCPEPFVKSYFGDDGSSVVPDDWRDLRFSTAAEVLFVAGSTVGVVVTGGAVVIGAAALTAGLTVGIAAKEVYKRLTNNYDI